MKITFLEAKVPLTKHFTATEKRPYPNAFEFTSHTESIPDLPALATAMQAHAKRGHCLLKGNLKAPLVSESRAGSTDAFETTNWICLDIDGLTSVTTIDDFMAKIGLHDHSYVLQWSSSYGVNGNFDLRAHVFLFLSSPMNPAVLKIWLKQLNLEHFSPDLKLTASNVALRWGLDITTCQNDKLIYITPPACTPPSIDQFTGARIQYIAKAKPLLDIAKSFQLTNVTDKEIEKINTLRVAAGLKTKTLKNLSERFKGNESYLADPDTATVNDSKEERGFTYLNINGGDSWGYWHPTNKPDFIHNFKGEPVYKTSEFLPAYWKHLQHAKRAANPSRLYLAFHFARQDQFYVGWYDSATDDLVLSSISNEGRLNNFLESHGQPGLDPIPSWDVIYDPHKPVIDIKAQTVNLFKASSYMKVAAVSKPPAVPVPTPMITKILEHVMGAALVPHYINWLAYCFVHRTAPKTAWIWHGIQGTGKGLIIDYVITPLFGLENVSQRRLEDLEDKFNDFLEHSLISFVDEVQVADSKKAKIVMQNLKNQITALVISVRRMHTSSYTVPNRIGWIFASNMPEPVTIEASDRRFNVGEFQRNKLQITLAEIQSIEAELTDFATMLQHYPIDEQLAATPIMNDAKAAMIEMGRASADVVADGLLKGQMSMLWDALPAGGSANLSVMAALALQPYQALVEDLIRNRRDKLTREELSVIFTYNVGSNTPTSPHKLASYLKHHGLILKRMRSVNNELCQGIAVSWTETDEWYEERIKEIDAKAGSKLKLVPPKAKP